MTPILAPQHIQVSRNVKIVTWNCNGAFRNKFQEIAKLEADTYVIQECENPEYSKGAYGKWAENHLRVGESKHKGLGIFASSSVRIQRLNREGHGLQLF